MYVSTATKTTSRDERYCITAATNEQSNHKW